MCDCMTFPDTVDEFMEQYKVVDTDGIYMSKGAELVPIFRMRQWFEHIPSAQPKSYREGYQAGFKGAQPEIVRCKDCKWFNDIGCAIYIVDDSDKPTENDYCSYGERKDG